MMGIAALAVRFVAELVGVAAAAYWGYQAGPDGIGRIALAGGAALGLIGVWAFVVAPKAENPLSQPMRNLIGTGLLLVVSAGLVAAGQPGFAIAFAAVVIIDQVAMVVLDPSAIDAVGLSTAARR